MGPGHADGGVGVTERARLGEERPSGMEIGMTELGVAAIDVGPVEAERRLVLEADMGVYGDAREYGELSIILADFGGTSGGVLPDRRRVPEDFRVMRWIWEGEDEGMTRGASDFGERGCFGEADLGLLEEAEELWQFCWMPCGIFAVAGTLIQSADIAISAFSSSAGPDMQDTMDSPKTCCRQLFPGALIDRSCSGGRPGIVAKTSNQFHRHNTTFLRVKLTRVHGYLLHCGHWTQFWNTNLSSADEGLLLGLQSKCSAK